MALICSETLLFIQPFDTRADAKVSEKNVPSTRKLHERPREGTERPRRVLMDSFPSGPAGPLIAALWGSRNETAYFCLCNWARVGLCAPAQIPVGRSQYLDGPAAHTAVRLPAGMRRMHGGCTSRLLSRLYALPIDIAIASGSNARVTISPSDCLRYIGP